MSRLIFCFSFFFLLFITGTKSAYAQDEIIDSLWEKFDHLPPDSSRVDTIIRSVLKLQHNIKNSPEEERMIKSALALSVKLGYKHGIANCYNLLGVYYRETSRYSEAISYHEKALQIGKDTRDSTIIGYALNSMGVAYRRLDDNEKAFLYHFEALNISKATNNIRGKTIAMNSIANIHLSMGDYKNAIEEFEQCLELEKEMGNNIGQAINNANIGAAYEALGEVDRAIFYYNESLKFNKLANSVKGLAICYNLLGQAYLNKQDYDRALSFLEEALTFNDKLKDRINVAENNITIGKIYQKKNDTYNALKFLNQGLSIADNIGSPSLKISAYEALAEIEANAGLTSKAFASLSNAYDLKDSLNKEQASPQMAKMRTLYELDKKEDQIRLLKQENEIKQLKLNNNAYLFLASVIIIVLFIAGFLFYLHYRKQKSKRLKLQYDLQSLRSQMNPHFIFNALNSIDNFIWKSNREEASSYLVKFSNLMRMTLQNSREKTIPLSVEIDFLKLYLELENFRRSEKFHYDIIVDSDIDSKALYIPSMVIQPFVENAILHGLSHKNGGESNLTVHFFKDNNLVVCEVVDNGIGRRNARIIQENKYVERRSLGIQVTEERVELLKKITGNKDLQIQIEDIENGTDGGTGTKVSIKLPLQYSITA